MKFSKTRVMAVLLVAACMGILTGCDADFRQRKIGPESSTAAVGAMLVATAEDDIESARFLAGLEEDSEVSDEELYQDLSDLRTFIAEAGGPARIKVVEKDRMGAGYVLELVALDGDLGAQIMVTGEENTSIRRFHVHTDLTPVEAP